MQNVRVSEGSTSPAVFVINFTGSKKKLKSTTRNWQLCLNFARLLHKKLFLSSFAFAEQNELQGDLAKRTLTPPSLKLAGTPLREYKGGEGKPACKYIR